MQGGGRVIWLHIEVPFTVVGQNELDERSLEEHVYEVLDHLGHLDVHDETISADLKTGLVTIELVAGGDTEGAALEVGLGAIRSAIHAAGGCTPDWPTLDDAFPGFDHEGPHGEWTKAEPTTLRHTDLVAV
jgi:hypothetical protein